MTEPETLRWVKSSYSNNGGSCVEWAPSYASATGKVPVRDSKNPHGPNLMFATGAFASFVMGVKGGELGTS
ncbi:DUF397 domain-containing protein [Streptomyces cavernicola]|uniref:DUF397 domain-containing protein n=1 Tax=Streptomyces cavernicola TaxID=3043613 RepID=A0ABT6SKX0_9ACTN|nr:DUF397 domain-containing protein [Streptomyces sp. B-S-A6]MDI3408845.1 DUF397 domain-containing protein [Streptomyces sp. B-S-A6]